MTIVDERLLLLDSITLNKGAHESFDTGHCALETAAWLAGEPHSDHPSCVSPVVGTFVRLWNDQLRSDDERDRLLKPLLPLMVGTATSKKDETTRAWMATDWLVREQTPAWLRLAGLDEHAHALENLKVLKGRASAAKAKPTIAAARDAAGAAARAVARAAARDAALDAALVAARAAAGDAAWDAAWAVADKASRDAARAAARDAAGAAARDATWDAMEPTVQLLQQSAVLLVTRMCDVGRTA